MRDRFLPLGLRWTMAAPGALHEEELVQSTGTGGVFEERDRELSVSGRLLDAGC